MARILRLTPAVAAAVLLSCSSGSGKDDTPDASPPSIAIFSPVAGDIVTTPTVLLRAIVQDAGGVASVEYAVDGGASQPMSWADGAYEVSVALPLADGAPMAFTVRARDRAGNEATATRNFTVDRVGPAIAIAGEDAACAEICTGAVLRAAEGPYQLAGSVTDGSGPVTRVLVIVRNEAGSEIGNAEVAVDETGSFAWDWNGFADGELVTFAVRADDQKGNSGHAERVVYVDRVPPTVSAGPNTPAPWTGPLVTFSEPMIAASVAAATTLTRSGGAPVTAGLAWADARSFGFTPDLEPFTRYQIEIGTGATDRAGNPLESPYGTSFETEMIPPPAEPTVVTTAVATGVRRPRLGVLVDGRPVVVYGTSDLGASPPRAVYWNGRGQWVDQEISNPALSGGVAVDLVSYYSALWALFSVPNGGAADLYFARTLDFASWSGWGDGPAELVATSVLPSWSPAFGVQCLLMPQCVTTALFGDDGGAKYCSRDPSGWSAPNLVMATGEGAHGKGNAFVDGGKVYYLDTRLQPPFHREVASVSQVGLAVGAEDWRPFDLFYMANPVVAFTTPRAGADPAADDLHLACHSAPWLRTPVALDATVEDLDLRLSSTTVAVAVALADGTVLFGTVPNGEHLCQSALAVPEWASPVADAREPAVALASDGTTVWKAWVKASTGELIVGR